MKLVQRLFEPVDNSQLIFFRIAFGLLMTLESWGAIATGWVKQAYIDTEFTFTFIGFEWLGFLHGDIMYAYYIVMGIVAICVMIGYRYGLFSVLLFLMWTGTYLLQKTNYNNHYYLLVLITGIMIFLPANRYYSLDEKRKSDREENTCPKWVPLLFIFQTAVLYFFASVAKLYPGWLRAEPMSIWLKQKAGYPIIGDLLQMDWMPYFISYGGIFFDGLIVPALLWKKTRKLALAVSLFFHLFNSFVFQVGVFPYLMLALIVFFYPAESIRRIFFKNKPSLKLEPKLAQITLRQKAWVTILAFYALVQILLPLRHWTYKGDVHWTEEGHRMAWQMMLKSKSGNIKFVVIDHDRGDTLTINPNTHLTFKQSRAIAIRPDMAWQYVQFLKQDLRSTGRENISIYANGSVRLNRGKSTPLIDPDMDLAIIEWERFSHAEWLRDKP
ncbi:MAG: HTTM domain-containing protein [Bacteroidetes bacterium]|nr:HTTM domain-containing protein [Bacteroidota bacterium]